MRKDLDEILLATGVSEMEFELIQKWIEEKKPDRFKLTYAREAPEVNYTYEEIGNSIKISDVAVVE